MCILIDYSKSRQRNTKLEITIQICKGCVCKRNITILLAMEQFKADKSKCKQLGDLGPQSINCGLQFQGC